MQVKQMSFLFVFNLFLHLSSIFSLSSAYTLPNKYFINCGSDSDSSFGHDRTFIGDAKPSSLQINPGKSEIVEDFNISKSIPKIYHTARVYRRPTWYEFKNIDQNGTYMVRFHFFPVSSQTHLDLSEARFDVWVSSMYQLLYNFSLHDTFEGKPVVKEFIFEIRKGPFSVHFSPSVNSPLAFVNAIEVFLVPDELKPESTYPVSPELRGRYGNNTEYELVSQAFETIYRLNMGGSTITPDNDTLWRYWLPDDYCMANSPAGKKVIYKGHHGIEYGTVTTIYTAPTFVYASARELRTVEEGNSDFDSLTWLFNVSRNSKYFVAMHWCDFHEDGKGNFIFDFFIGGNRTDFNSASFDHSKFVPFRLEMVLVTDNWEFFTIGLARNLKIQDWKVFLNGLEMMKLIDKSHLEIRNEKKHTLLIGVLVGGVIMLATLVIGLFLFYNRARKSKNPRRSYEEFLSHDKQLQKTSISDLAPNLNLELKISFSEIQRATNDFAEDQVIGVGGFGKVYHGTLHDKEVAVKRSRPGFGQGLREFQTEIIILSQIRHRHLVSFYGYCDENEEMILVYEFMEKGTLRQYLYGSNHPSLSWNQRLEICINAAKGLDYLHTGSAGGVIIHRDVKTTNILLDKYYTAKVADFGISKSGLPNPNECYATIRGTYGYLDPTYFSSGLYTEKSDVYSFGVVLFEVLSARSPVVNSGSEDEINLADWALLCKSRGEIEKIIDPLLLGTIESNSLQKFLEIAEKCLNESWAERPSMHEVVSGLELALQFQNTLPENRKLFDGTIVELPSPTL